MNNDLISRSYLHTAIGKCVSERHGYFSLRDIKEAIDNAPAVFSCNACKNMGNEQECADCHDYSNYVHYCDERLQDEWISVSERLPEALQSVLVTSKSGRVYTSYIAHGDWEYGGEVIAWQSLPKPYESGGAE